MDNKQLGFLEKTVKLVEKYGLFKILKALLVITLFIYIMTNGAQMVERVIERVTRETIQDEAVEKSRLHDIALEKRQEIKPMVDDILNSTLTALDADRVFVIEMHNGTNNVSGLPFLYGEMTYETVMEGIDHVDDDYMNFSLSRFNFPSYIEKEHIWAGTIEELERIDDKLAKRLMSNDVTYLAIAHIHGIKNELGFYGVTYCNGKTPKDRTTLTAKMLESTQKLSTLLDSSNLIELVNNGELPEEE